MGHPQDLLSAHEFEKQVPFDKLCIHPRSQKRDLGTPGQDDRSLKTGPGNVWKTIMAAPVPERPLAFLRLVLADIDAIGSSGS